MKQDKDYFKITSTGLIDPLGNPRVRVILDASGEPVSFELPLPPELITSSREAIEERARRALHYLGDAIENWMEQNATGNPMPLERL